MLAFFLQFQSQLIIKILNSADYLILTDAVWSYLTLSDPIWLITTEFDTNVSYVGIEIAIWLSDGPTDKCGLIEALAGNSCLKWPYWLMLQSP